MLLALAGVSAATMAQQKPVVVERCIGNVWR